MSDVVWRAPGRVNLIGEHTDYNNGFALPLAIAQGCTARLALTTDPVVRITSAQEQRTYELPLAEITPASVSGWGAYVAGVVVTMLTRYRGDVGVSVEVDSDVPSGAGLSSSAALVCSIAAALDDALGTELPAAELVAIARIAENDFAGAPTGGMDQLASICCTEGAALLCDMQSLATRPIPLDLVAAGLTLLVIDTQAPHQHADGEYRERREACERAAALLGVASLREVQDLDHPKVLADLAAAAGSSGSSASAVDVLVRRVRHVLTENDRVLEVCARLSAGDVASIGPLLTASHASMRDDYEITVAEVDTAVEAALAAGALGARMTGGGFGGCVIALARDDRAGVIEQAVTEAFDASGFGPPVTFHTAAHAGAHRVSERNPR